MTSAKYDTLTSKVIFFLLALAFLFSGANSLKAAPANKGKLNVVKITDCKREWVLTDSVIHRRRKRDLSLCELCLSRQPQQKNESCDNFRFHNNYPL